MSLTFRPVFRVWMIVPLCAIGLLVWTDYARMQRVESVWCPLADNLLHFAVTGPATYRGSYNFYATHDRGLNYHSPGDPELQAEGGVMRAVIRTGFTQGIITVTASTEGMKPASASFASVEAAGSNCRRGTRISRNNDCKGTNRHGNSDDTEY